MLDIAVWYLTHAWLWTTYRYRCGCLAPYIRWSMRRCLLVIKNGFKFVTSVPTLMQQWIIFRNMAMVEQEPNGVATYITIVTITARTVWCSTNFNVIGRTRCSSQECNGARVCLLPLHASPRETSFSSLCLGLVQSSCCGSFL
jgi:hypothetical protein